MKEKIGNIIFIIGSVSIVLGLLLLSISLLSMDPYTKVKWSVSLIFGGLFSLATGRVLKGFEEKGKRKEKTDIITKTSTSVLKIAVIIFIVIFVLFLIYSFWFWSTFE